MHTSLLCILLSYYSSLEYAYGYYELVIMYAQYANNMILCA